MRNLPALNILTGLLVAATVALAAVSVVDQRDSDSHSDRLIQSSSKSSAEGTALVYLTRVQIERRGLVAIVTHARDFQSYLPPGDFDASVSDGLSLLAGRLSSSTTIRDLSNFSGQVVYLYNGLLAKVRLGERLRSAQLGQVCFALPFANRLEDDLAPAAKITVHLSPVGQCGPRGYVKVAGAA
jgi:hypothetical protein